MCMGGAVHGFSPANMFGMFLFAGIVFVFGLVLLAGLFYLGWRFVRSNEKRNVNP